MNFNPHYELKDRHAFLSASQYHWLNYDKDRLIAYYQNDQAKRKGTELHEFAAKAIKLGQKLSASKKTINMYVNDAIGYKMTPEQPLFYSRNCFGTTDAISFRRDFLRIHDLKTGETPASMKQLMIYAALFCLEYNVKPADIQMELRIYQLDAVEVYQPTADEISDIMQRIIEFDMVLEKQREKE